ncbi:hypothetical protein [Roseateles sp. LKC17W]|uniref:Uncharacterized protein n=1 Tax=Pelomonas margarita TaxID=3299031 RepID=A0ABW7FIE4_9BURK
MSITTIPAKTIKTCDRCKAVMDGRNDRQEGALLVKAHALDMHGHACADASRKFDLCDSCLYTVAKTIDAAMASHVPVQDAQS